MKKKVFYLAFLLLGLAVASCKDDGGENPEPGWTPAPQPDFRGRLMDGGSISDVEFYCPKTRGWGYDGNKIIRNKDYSDLYLIIKIRNDNGYSLDDQEEMATVKEMEKEYYREKTAFMLEAEAAAGDHGNRMEWPELYTAYTYGRVSITCDKTLFGQEPGTDLSGFFSAVNYNPCVPVGVEDPAFVYNYGEDIPADMRSAFPVNVWLAPEYTLLMNTCPEERYDKLTFRLAMPIRKEHTRDYIVSKYRGTGKPLESTDHLFEKECDAYFDWN